MTARSAWLVGTLVAVGLLCLVAAVATSRRPGDEGRTGPRFSSRPERIAAGVLLDSPVSPETIEESLAVIAGLRARYGLTGGAEADEEAARRALAELESIEFSRKDVLRMATRLGLDLDPAHCGEACENLERLALVRLKMERLRLLAGVEPPAQTLPRESG